MVWANPQQPGEAQLQRHAASHLPDGQDPLYAPTNADLSGGQVVVYINGQPVWQSISQIFNTFLTAAMGAALAAAGDAEEGPMGPPGPAGAAGATGATGAAGTGGSGTGAVYLPDAQDDFDGIDLPLTHPPGETNLAPIVQVKTLKRAAGVASSSGDNTAISSVSGKVIKVYAYALQGLGTVNAKFLDGSGGTQVSILWNFQTREGISVAGVEPPSYLFKGTATTALILNLSGNVSVGYEISYFDDDAS